MELLRDRAVSRIWPRPTSIGSALYIDRGLLESATARPFSSAGGLDAYPTILDKATALFHSLIANHPFYDGNKRTAVLALDNFLLANGYLLNLTNDAMYKLAKRTATYKERGLSLDQSMSEISDSIGESSVSLPLLKEASKGDSALAELYADALKLRKSLRTSKLNKLV